MSSLLLSLSLLALTSAQQIATSVPEVHPKITWRQCTLAGGCTNQAASVVLDANWRWLHTTSGTNCYTGSAWDTAICPNPQTCAANCGVDGADYATTYGITTTGDAISHKFVTKTGTGTNVGSRVYLMDTSDRGYQIFRPKNQEFTFDVDVSQLPCGLNGALYFVEMDADGGVAKHPGNKAGAKYGTGYCDAQCPHDIKFINGEANTIGWTGSPADPNSGVGQYGTCCPEMDIWESNSMATAYTPHPCSVVGQTRCSGAQCGDGDGRYGGVCDKDGCDFNSFRLGNKSFFGKGKTVDSTKKVTVVTQFITNNNTPTGTLTEIRRLYVQNGVVFQNSAVAVPGIPTGNSITSNFCTAQKSVFGDNPDFTRKGGLAAMGDSLGRGVVLVMSIWDDYAVNMLWLNSPYPPGADVDAPGVARGECPPDSGKPEDLERDYPNATVTYSNIRFGEIGSTYGTGGGGTPPVTPPGGGGGTIPKYQQCGGIGWTGSGTCAAGSTCQVGNPYYSQCL